MSKFLIVLLVVIVATACEKETIQITDSRPTADEIVLPQAKNSTNNSKKFEIGGSNYPVYDVQNYINTGVWSTQNLKVAVGDFHLNPNTVKTQLRKMYDRGQRKIAVPIWFSVYSSNIVGTRSKHLIKINGGDMSAQHKQNLRDLVDAIKLQGYNEISVRFMQQWLSHPKTWTNGWDEALYQQNWNFIVKAVRLVNTQLGNSNIRVTYDLGANLGASHENNPKPTCGGCGATTVLFLEMSIP